MIDHLIRELAERGELRLTVRARPAARRTVLKDIMADGALKIDLAAPPEDGAANEELCRFVAELFSLPLSSVALVSGATARIKQLRLKRPVSGGTADGSL